MENQMTESRQRMTSLEIAEVTGKPHNDVMKAIRKMEPAWVRICQGKFSLTSRMVQQPNGGTREVPCYSLTKTKCLYVATKINDEARAKLVLRLLQKDIKIQIWIDIPNGSTTQRRNSQSSLLLSYKDRVSVCCNKI